MGVLTNLSLFSGAGGLDIGARLTGSIRTVCYVEYDPYAQAVLMSRIRDKSLDDAPIWDDVSTFDGRPWCGRVDIVSGGFPCQDVSIVGKRGGVSEGTRSGLWFEYSRIICEVRPRFVFVENVPGLLDGWLGIVLGDLAGLGFDAEWGVLGSCVYGAPHTRERVWLLAYPNGFRRNELGENQKIIGSGIHLEGTSRWKYDTGNLLSSVDILRASPMRGVVRVDDGLAEGVDRLRLCGNGVDPYVAYGRWKEILRIDSNPDGGK